MLGNLLGALKGRLTSAAQQFSGNKNFLEATCAAGVLSAFSDGSASDQELMAARKAIVSNEALSSFRPAEIDAMLDKMIQRAEGGRMGRAGLWKEIDDILHNPEMCQAVVLAALDVAESQGGIDANEQKFLEELAGRLKVDLKRLMAI